MSDVASHLAVLRDPRLAAHATSAAPAWLWSADASRILWANPVGAAIFGAPVPADLAARRFEPRDQAAAQIARLAGSLRLGGAPRLERLRGFGGGFLRATVCACSRIALADHTPGILVVATEPAGPALSLAERVRRLIDGSGLAVAAFAPSGALLHATQDGRARLGSHATLADLGAGAIGADALAHGRAEGDTPLGRLTVERLGEAATAVLVATFAPAPAAPSAPPVEEPVAAAPPPPEEVVPASAPAAPEIAEAPPQAPPVAAQSMSAPAVETPPPRIDAPLPERDHRHPLRFVWQMDADGRFTLGSDEFTEVIGRKIATALGRPWAEINAALALDPEGQVARATATRDTWSGITLSWPVEDCADRLKVELSGLPIYDRNRSFQGYRGFGVCRDVERIATLAAMRRSAVIPAPPAARVAPPPEPPAAPPEPAPEPAAATPEPAPEPALEPLLAPAPQGSADARPTLTLVPPSPNVVPFRGPPSADAKPPVLSPVERNAFHELARQLTARLKGEAEAAAAAEPAPTAPAPAAASVLPLIAEPKIAEPAADAAMPEPAPAPPEPAPAHEPAHMDAPSLVAPGAAAAARALIDRLPVGILIYRLDTLLHANRAFLAWTGHADLAALTEAGGLDTLFVENAGQGTGHALGDTAGTALAIATPRGDKRPVEGRLLSVPWDGESALALVLAGGGADDRVELAEAARRLAETHASEQQAIADAATDGVLMVEPNGRIVAANRGAASLFGEDATALAARNLADLLAPESARAALDDLARTARGETTSGREIAARVGARGSAALLMTLERIPDGSGRIAAVLRDVTARKLAERDVAAARQEADKATAARSDFLAKVNHELRAPLNSIVGFAEVMLEERFGPIGNERYREYLKDIRASGDHAAALLNDLVDLSKIAAGNLELAFAELNLNDTVQGCVELMQPQANREHIIIRTSFAPHLPAIVADPRALRQITLNLLSNSIRFTGAGGQVIVSTAASGPGEAVLRVRDTGIGMDDKELAAALDPFRRLTTGPRWHAGGTGLCLPLTKALAEANRARFTISSKVNDGTLIEVAFAAASAAAD